MQEDETMDKALAKERLRGQKHFTEVYFFCRVILTDF